MDRAHDSAALLGRIWRCQIWLYSEKVDPRAPRVLRHSKAAGRHRSSVLLAQEIEVRHVYHSRQQRGDR